jgi:methionine aminotransferase
MINTPHNPAGTILRDADMKRIADMLRGTDILLLERRGVRALGLRW